MKTLVFTDLHLHDYPKFGIDERKHLPKRLVEQKSILQQILDICIKYKIKRIRFGGDWFHHDKDIPIECLNVTKWFFEELNRLGIEFIAVRGNHDLSNKSYDIKERYSLHPFLKDQLDQKDTYLGHYDVIHDVNKIKGYDLVLIHQTPIGSKLHSFTFEEGIDWKTLAENNKFVLFGHIHQRQQLSDNCWVLGPPMHLDFGDREARGVMIFEDNNWEFVSLNYPQFITLDALKDPLPEKDLISKNYIRIINDDSNSIIGNVVHVKKPTYFENRLKSITLVDILKEWLQKKDKPESYLDPITSLLQETSDIQKKILDLTLTSVELTNFLSFEKASLDITRGLNLVEGVGGDFSSNGSGKSSLFEGIFWCIFGETTKGLTGDDVIRKYPEKQKDCEVVVQLRDYNNDTDYRITRSRKHGLKVSINGGLQGHQYSKNLNTPVYTDLTDGMKQKDSQEFLEQLIGFNKTTFCASSYFSQDAVLLLTKLGVADKNSIITELLGFDQYDVLDEKVSTMINENEASLSMNNKKKEAQVVKLQYIKTKIESFVEREKTVLDKAKTAKEAGEKIKGEITIKENELNELKSQDITEKLKLIDEQDDTLKNESVLNREEQAIKLKAKQEYERNPDRDALNRKLSELIGDRNYQQNGLADKEKLLLKYNKLKDGQTCEYCSSVITEEHRKTYINKIESDITIIKNTLKSISDEYNKLSEQKDVYDIENKKLSDDYQRSWNRGIEIGEIRLKISKDRQKLVESSNQSKQYEIIIEGLKQRFEFYKNTIQDCKSEYNKIKEEKQKEVDFHSQEELSLVTLEYWIGKTQDILQILSFWKEAFSYKGIKSLLLDNFCNSFNEILSLYMLEVSNGVMTVEFSPVSTTKSGESRNKLDLMIYVGGNLQSYGSLSGGEKKRVDCGVAISFARWLKRQYKLSSSLLGIMIFDELFDSLDANARECILPMLKQEGEENAVFIISHTPDLGAYSDNVIKVRKTNRVSSLV